ncbi:MAG TPA: glycosyltransferase family A protein [Devosia sp.]|nr:glycosyltransferase family A protein [Devosia sp.]
MDYTVVIPAYNAGRFIADAVRSALAQTQPPVRVIVVDDGSTDAIEGTIASLGSRVHLVRQEHSGPGAATTRGIGMVETGLLATLDADDIWLPGKLARQIDTLEADPNLAGVFGRLANFRGDPESADYGHPYDGWSRTTMLVRTEIARAVGPVIDPPDSGDMVDWLARLREAGHRLSMLPEILALRRVHEDSMTFRGRHEVAAGYISVARAAMLRRRAAGPR